MARKALFCLWRWWWYWNYSHCVQRVRDSVCLISKPWILIPLFLHAQIHIPSLVPLRCNNCILLRNLLPANQTLIDSTSTLRFFVCDSLPPIQSNKFMSSRYTGYRGKATGPNRYSNHYNAISSHQAFPYKCQNVDITRPKRRDGFMQTEEEFGDTVNKTKLMQFTPAIRGKGERVGRETKTGFFITAALRTSNPTNCALGSASLTK